MRAEHLIQFPERTCTLDGVDREGVCNIIVAPHCDDEVIGCAELLYTNGFNIVVPCRFETPLLTNRLDESAKAIRFLHDDNQMAAPTSAMGLIDALSQRVRYLWRESTFANFICWFPDPSFETHPEHKLVGEIGRYFARSVTDDSECPALTGFYSVNMLAPYVQTLKPAAQNIKREALERFHSQSDYFAQHQESWIFEGRYLV